MRRVGNQLVGAPQDLPVQWLVHALLTTAHQVRAFDLHQVPIDIAGVDHDLDPGHFAVVLALDQLALVDGTERLEERHVLGLLPGAAVTDHHHFRCRLGTAQACGQGQQQGGKHMLERIGFHRGFLVQVPRGQGADAALFYCCEVRPRGGRRSKLLQRTVKKQVDFLLWVNFYSENNNAEPLGRGPLEHLHVDLKPCFRPSFRAIAAAWQASEEPHHVQWSRHLDAHRQSCQ
ncbi:hypothetical protein EMIT0324P_11743 [Pseudomonas chlororaphis]